MLTITLFGRLAGAGAGAEVSTGSCTEASSPASETGSVTCGSSGSSSSARFSSPLSVDDFVKKTQFSYYTEDALAKVAAKVEFFAKKEGLTAHAKSAIIRTESKRNK